MVGLTRLPAPHPQRPCYQNITAGDDPAAPVTSQSSRCILALVSLCLDLYSPCHDPLPIPTHPPLLNTHRGPINPIMQMEVINRTGFSLFFPLRLPSFLHVSHHATTAQGFPAT